MTFYLIVGLLVLLAILWLIYGPTASTGPAWWPRIEEDDAPQPGEHGGVLYRSKPPGECARRWSGVRSNGWECERACCGDGA